VISQLLRIVFSPSSTKSSVIAKFDEIEVKLATAARCAMLVAVVQPLSDTKRRKWATIYSQRFLNPVWFCCGGWKVQGSSTRKRLSFP